MTVVTKPARPAPPPIRGWTAEVVAALAQKTKFVDPQLAAQWKHIVGDDLAALCRPGRLTGGRADRTLEVFALNGAAAARVQFESENLRRRLNDVLGPNTVGRVLVKHCGRDAPGPGAPDAGLGTALDRFRAAVSSRKSDEKP